jgi:hypothetical protein
MFIYLFSDIKTPDGVLKELSHPSGLVRKGEIRQFAHGQDARGAHLPEAVVPLSLD